MRHIIVLTILVYVGYGEYVCNKIDDALVINELSYEEFTTQGVSELANQTRTGLISDYIKFRMTK